MGALPILVLGLAALLDRLESRALWRAALGVMAMLVLWNFAFVVQYRLALVPRHEPLSASQMVTEKFLLPVRILSKRPDGSAPSAR